MNKKQIYFIAQSKGGVGKSFLTTLLAHKYEETEETMFVDMDSSTRTLSKQIAFIDNPNYRIVKQEILNSSGKIERDSFVTVLENLVELAGKKIFVDFGATESDQLYQFFLSDIEMEDLIAFFEESNTELTLVIPIAGNTALASTLSYAQEMIKVCNNSFPVLVMENEELTSNDDSFEIEGVLGVDHRIYKYGKTEGDTDRGKRIVQLIQQAKSMRELGTLTVSKLKKIVKELPL